ncbi:MAG: biotin-dependent carboxyltransferase family protein [Cryomorphaceae bacterium]
MIKVLHPGIYNTVQDQGRRGYAKMGIPTSGAMDDYAARLANTMMRNRESDALIEITMGQGKFQFMETTAFCLTGGDFSPNLDGELLETNRVYSAKEGAVLSFGRRNYGAISYLAVPGGIRSDLVLKSRSFSRGITQDRLEREDDLKILPNQASPEQGYSRIRMKEEHYHSPTLPCFPGPEFNQLTESQKERLFALFTLSRERNRVGYRLNETLENELNPILTSAVIPGTVQLTPSGNLIVLMRDCQVSGGYPRVLQLSENAISALSQKVSGDEMCFEVDQQKNKKVLPR